MLGLGMGYCMDPMRNADYASCIVGDIILVEFLSYEGGLIGASERPKHMPITGNYVTH